jgi:hypothetical protein
MPSLIPIIPSTAMSSSLFRSLPHPFQELPGIGCVLRKIQF